MATGRTTITIEHPDTDLSLNLTDKAQTLAMLEEYLAGFGAGALRFGGASVTVEQGGAHATASISLDTAGGEIFVTIAGVTVEEDGSNYGSDSETAAALATIVNGTEGTATVVDAMAVGPNVLLTARQPGALGNLVTLEVLGNGTTYSGPTLSGGINPTGRKLDF